MTQANESPDLPAAGLGLGDALALIVGIVVGVGIFQTPPRVLNSVSGPGLALAVWAAGGVLSLLGALCYAELASTYPRSGGDYVYLGRAYAPWVGFLFAWAQLAVVQTGNIGMMAYVFADHAREVWGGSAEQGWLWACLAVLALTLLNLLGLAFGKGVQNVLTVLKVLGLAAVLAAGCAAPSPGPAVTHGPAPALDLAAALVLVLLTYGGWSDIAYVAAEVRDGPRRIPRALVLGVTFITLIYLLLNAVYLYALGFDGARQSRAVAGDVLQQTLGDWGRRGICLAVMVSALGATNGLILSGARVASTLGTDHALFAWLAHRGRRGPWAALLTQAAVAAGFIAAVGTAAGQHLLGGLFARAGLPAVDWEGRSGFEALLRCTAPVYWLFFLLTALALFVLRYRDAGIKRPFSVPLYPVVPFLFCLTCAGMLYSGVLYAWTLGLVGGTILLAGLPLYALSRALSRPGGAPDGRER